MQGDFKEFFTTEDLTEQKLGEIEFVLNSPAYGHTFKPFMLGILNAINKLWKDRSAERKAKYNDDYLAGGHDFGEGLIQFFERIINETHDERVMKSLGNMTNDDLYEYFRERGYIKPVVGANQQAEPAPYDPAEDF